MARPLRVATRGSELARHQAGLVARRLGPDTELVIVSTTGDRRRDVPIHAMGGTGVFVKEVQDAVLVGEADLAVHSAKDLPAGTPDGLVLAAFPERAAPWDALVGCSLSELPTGARVGTGSVRRRSQLAAVRPDLGFGELRGNIGTRVARAGDFDAVVVALAALERLGLRDRVAEVLEPSVMLPQVGQGALAVECRVDDHATCDRVAELDDSEVRAAVTAERSFLGALGGGCTLPCAALARRTPGGRLAVDVALASLDGHVMVRARLEGDDPRALGAEAARSVLEDHGGRGLLSDALADFGTE